MKKIFKTLLKILCLLLAAVIVLCGILLVKVLPSVSAISPVDEAGWLYSMDVNYGYNSNLCSLLINKAISAFGCSAFAAKSPEGQILTGRNYDLKHTDSEGNLTGLNLVVHCSPKGGYESYGIADACWLSYVSHSFTAGGFDSMGAEKLLTVAAPYLCMDGINEKGLTLSVLYLDTKDGETPVSQSDPDKESVLMTVLMRYMLDSCADVQEALELAQSYNLVNTAGMDLHLFLTDASGTAAVFEWRNNTLTVSYQNAVTNFYVGYSDAQDLYHGDTLFDEFLLPDIPAEALGAYGFGYGHGYGRFAVLAEALYAKANMSNSEAMELLSQVAQAPSGHVTSFTQYSVVYNSTELCFDVCVNMDYSRSYHFGFGE